MRKSLFLTFLLLILTLLGSTVILQAQAVVEGQVVDAESEEPLANAHVFLSNTKIGAVTDASGHYRIKEIPEGAYKLIVSIIGYDRKSFDLKLGSGDAKNINVELNPVTYKMSEIFIGDFDEEWEEDLERFTHLFIGGSQRADSVKILNPEVLRFETNWWGRFTAEALAPLQIENHTLGYELRYYLNEFNHDGYRTRWDGEPLFTEMAPADSQQAEYWKKNRIEAFYGSPRHFFLALIQDHVREAGFLLYQTRNNLYNSTAKSRFSISADQLIEQGDEDYLYHLTFNDQLEVVYTRDSEDKRYIDWARHLDRSPASTQTSQIELNERPVTIDTNGEVLETYGATLFGYFGYHRIADLLPNEYRPEGYQY